MIKLSFFKNFFGHHPLQIGFTLIELIVVIGLVILLVGGAIPGYIDFNDRQIVTGAVKELKTYFQLAQSRAQSGDLGDCTELAGYRLQTSYSETQQETTVTLTPVCETGSGTAQAYTIAQAQVLAGGSDLDMTFGVLQGSIDLGGSNEIDVEISYGAKTYGVTIKEGGDFNETGFTD